MSCSCFGSSAFVKKRRSGQAHDDIDGMYLKVLVSSVYFISFWNNKEFITLKLLTKLEVM